MTIHTSITSAPPKRPSPRVMRATLENAIDRLLGAVENALTELDALDGDPDAEPSLGSRLPEGWEDQTKWASRGDGDDREHEHDGREPDVDDEYSLGWAESEGQGAPKGHHLTLGRPSDEDEPSLGSSAAVDQSQWGDLEPFLLDREEQCEDEGGACEDEGAPDDREPDFDDMCNWADEGDQTRLRPMQVYAKPVPSQRPLRKHANLTGYIAVRRL